MNIPKTVWAFLATIVLALIAAAVDYSHAPKGDTIQKVSANTLHIGEVAPNFSFTPLDAGAAPMQLIDLRGKVVLINFWATWCPPCIKELPILIDVAAAYPDNVVILLISADKNADIITEYMRNNQRFSTILEDNNLLTIWDEKRQISRVQYQVTRYPESILINRQGVATEKIVGMVAEETIHQKIKALLGD